VLEVLVRPSILRVAIAALLVAAAAVGVSAFLAGRSSRSMHWVIQDLGTLGGSHSSPSDMNGRGQIVGVSDTSRSSHAFLWENGRMIDLGTFGGTYSSAEAINERGEIVGLRISDPTVAAEVDGFPYKSFPVLWRNGRVTMLPEVAVPGCFGNMDWILGINDRGDVAGTISFSTNASRCQRAVLWRGGRWRVLDGLSHDVMSNNRGEIIGSGRTGLRDLHALQWENGTTTDLGSLGDGYSEAVAINDRGQIIGSSVPHTMGLGSHYAFLWQDGEMIGLGTLGGATSYARAINERGQIIGSSATTSGASHAFLWQNGKMIDLGTLGGATSYAGAINERGQIVGSSATASTGRFIFSHAFVWQNGKMIDLGTLGGKNSSALKINNRGQVVGWSTTRTGRTHAVLWTLRSG